MLHKQSTAAWREIGGRRIYFRSLWESNFARWLQFQQDHKMIIGWEYEPKTFWFEGIRRGCVSYKPDFMVSKFTSRGIPEIIWFEVKGYYDPKSLTKIKRFRKYFPHEKLFLIDTKWFSENSKKLKLIIPDWEVGKCALKHHRKPLQT